MYGVGDLGYTDMNCGHLQEKEKYRAGDMDIDNFLKVMEDFSVNFSRQTWPPLFKLRV